MAIATIRRYFFAGLLILLPILATYFVISVIIDLLDKSLNFLPAAYHPKAILGYHIPGIGVVLSILIVIITGMITTNIIGRHFVHWAERLLARIPLVRTIYHASKQVLTTLFSSDSRSFRHVVLVEYPRRGLWSIAFETGEVSNLMHEQVGQDDLITIFLPTTPNPTSGFLMLVPRKDTRPLDITVDDALKMVISLGVVQPKSTIHGVTTIISTDNNEG